MKIICLNTWGGKAGKEKILDFFHTYKNTVDIFCLQEMWRAPYGHLGSYKAGGVDMRDEEIMVYGVDEISKVLKGHNTFFRPHHLDDYGLMMSVHKDIAVHEEGEVFVHKFKNFIPVGDVGLHARNVQFVKIMHRETPYTIMNFHGLWNGKGKTDSVDRIEQSKKIAELIKTIEGEVVICGDFNLLPDTKSIKMLEEAGLVNLIKEYRITSTRTSLYSKSEKFADYIFVSKGVSVKDFKVLSDEVSDHTPLYLELE